MYSGTPSTHDIVAPTLYTPSDDHQHDDWAETHLGREVVFCAEMERDVHIVLRQIVSIVLAGCTLAWIYLHLLCHFFLYMTWIRILRQLFGLKSSCRVISLKIVLIFLSYCHCNFWAVQLELHCCLLLSFFWRWSIASWISFFVNSGMGLCWSGNLSSFSVRDSVLIPRHLLHLRTSFRRFHRKHLQFPVSCWWFRLFCFWPSERGFTFLPTWYWGCS